MNYTISVQTKTKSLTFDLAEGSFQRDGFSVAVTKNEGDFYKLKITPAEGPITSIKHVITTGLRNFHTVICPDSGRNYPKEMQLVNFWSNKRASTHFDIKAPIYIFTGQNHNTDFAFGVMGKDYETEFTPLEPTLNRALQAHFRRLTLSISRGTEKNPIPKEISMANPDCSIEEGIFVRDYENEQGVPWISTLREFSNLTREMFNIEFPYDKEALEPLWCSWTDWHSTQIDEKVILDNVEEGVKLGITNYVVDDGWFGPALDSEFGTKLLFGDWEAEGTRYKDIKELSRSIRKAGGRSIIWCAPHTITPTAKKFIENYDYLMKDKFGVPIFSYNKLNLYCPRCKEGRAKMAEICADLVTKYETDGAKYDLFNIYPDEECMATDHEHDTDSNVVGLTLMLAEIWEKIRKEKPDYLVELKQNYGWVFLSQYGSMTRAGDTPYNPEGNFMRTAFVQAYHPYAINDYQTITNYDNVPDSARIVIKMMSVGIPTYSMDITKLTDDHKKMLKFFNFLYLDMIKDHKDVQRIPLDANLGLWLLRGKNENIYFAVNEGNTLNITENRSFKILNANIYDEINIIPEFDREYEAIFYNCLGEVEKKEAITLKKGESFRLKTSTSGVVAFIYK